MLVVILIRDISHRTLTWSYDWNLYVRFRQKLKFQNIQKTNHAIKGIVPEELVFVNYSGCSDTKPFLSMMPNNMDSMYTRNNLPTTERHLPIGNRGFEYLKYAYLCSIVRFHDCHLRVLDSCAVDWKHNRGEMARWWNNKCQNPLIGLNISYNIRKHSTNFSYVWNWCTTCNPWIWTVIFYF